MTGRIQRDPVYQQLNELLRSTLAAEYGCGDRFLTEREISQRYEVSRATANKALASLVSEGVLEFRRGIGTFVRRDLIDHDVRSLVSFTEKARAAGKKPTTQLLTFKTIDAANLDPAIKVALQVPDDGDLWELERVRFADQVPVIFEHRFVVRSLCSRLTRAQASSSLYRAWTNRHRLEIEGADAVIRAILPTPREAECLHVSPATPVLEVVAVGTVAPARPLWWERTLYRGDQYEFHSRLGPIRSATPARGKLRSP
ncbi:GntR family transcriptional regulator [Roseiconus nitratireducens]|uniref:GntR family transcriptional regulator n=1 Tax=Roseiconus nitratireducens TaxID=2605748 RepID=A0A5M6D2V5_9BACT|nr:GntR family transcriptional regulator [Roseiconus nitratireducens]KAA5540920.1 GntR family transcriptional regulator [Roseiconus nitratireducens]